MTLKPPWLDRRLVNTSRRSPASITTPSNIEHRAQSSRRLEPNRGTQDCARGAGARFVTRSPHNSGRQIPCAEKGGCSRSGQNKVAPCGVAACFPRCITRSRAIGALVRFLPSPSPRGLVGASRSARVREIGQSARRLDSARFRTAHRDLKHGSYSLCSDFAACPRTEGKNCRREAACLLPGLIHEAEARVLE
jgi:hypothetical protein